MYISIMYYYYIVVHSFFLLIGLDTEYLKKSAVFSLFMSKRKIQNSFLFCFWLSKHRTLSKTKFNIIFHNFVFSNSERNRESKCLFLGQQNTSITPMVRYFKVVVIKIWRSANPFHM